jgi:hypothetical protein
MPTTRKHGGAVVAATLGILLSGALVGCSVTKDDTSTKRTPSSTPEPTASQSSEPSESATPTASISPSSSATATSTPATPQAALLAAGSFPQLNATSPWTQGRTTVPGPTSFGLCQQFDILSIGAMNVVERSYRTGATGGDTAGQQIAEFPDAQNTVRASKVLEAWHSKCTTQGGVRGKNVKVRPITDVPVSHGKGWWYLVSYTRGGTGHFHSFGVAYSGNRMTLLKIDHVGQDHNYAPGHDPMELAVKAASAKMG